MLDDATLIKEYGLDMLDEIKAAPVPSALTFPADYNMPDAICGADIWCYDFDSAREMPGIVMQLISPRAFSFFPNAPKDGPHCGLVWIAKEQWTNLCYLQMLHGLQFEGLYNVVH